MQAVVLGKRVLVTVGRLRCLAVVSSFSSLVISSTEQICLSAKSFKPAGIAAMLSVFLIASEKDESEKPAKLQTRASTFSVSLIISRLSQK